MEVQQVIEGSPQSLKRDFPYDADVISTVECTADKQHQTAPCSNEGTQPERQSTPMGSEDRTRETSTPLSSPAPTSTRTISIISTPPQLRTLPAFNGAEEPPKKRVKLTFAEKEEKRIMKEIRDREKAEEKAKREAERRFKEAEREAERVKREAEKEEKRLAKEAEKAEKEKERRAKEEERKAKEEEKEKDRKAKEEERRKKDEEKQRIEEEKQKKARLQPKLNSFFVMKTPTKKDDNPPDVASAAAVDTSSPSKTVSDKSEYAKLFPPFFVQTNVIVAPTTKFERDEQAAESLHKALDSYITGQRSPQKARPFDAAKLFRLADTRRSRGKKTVPVRTIMAQILGNKQQPIDLTTDSQLNRIRDAREQLKRVPYKILAFAEDVRPPYKGSYTIEPRIGMRKMARNPFNRGLANVNYDYDSEAEWEEPEEGEDVDLDDEEEEDLGDGDEDIAEFLDDTEDTAAVRRLAIQGDLEPVCTGICWEYGKGKGQNPELKQYRMEIMSPPGVKIRGPIDPFFNYWDDDPKPTPSRMEPPRKPLDNLKSTNALLVLQSPSSSKPADSPKPNSTSKDKPDKEKKLVPPDLLPAFKAAVHGSELSKVGLIEVLSRQFMRQKVPKAAIKNSLELVAKRVGTKEADKRWVVEGQ